MLLGPRHGTDLGPRQVMVQHGDYFRQSVRNSTGPDEGEHADAGDGYLFEARDWRHIGNLAGRHLRLGLRGRKTMSPKPPICMWTA